MISIETAMLAGRLRTHARRAKNDPVSANLSIWNRRSPQDARKHFRMPDAP